MRCSKPPGSSAVQPPPCTEFWALGSKSCFGAELSVEPDRSGRHSMSTVALAAGAPPQNIRECRENSYKAPESVEFEGV